MQESHRLMQERIRKAQQLRELGVEPYAYRFDRTARAKEVLDTHKTLKPGEERSERVAIAGRIMLLRSMGKLTFAQLEDESGRIQLALREDDLNDAYRLVKLLDIGDIIGVEGSIFATKTGEVTLKVAHLTPLTKALRPLPDKHKGLQEKELRYRYRHLDLIANPQVRELFYTRAAIIRAIRAYLDENGLIEVETPTLQPIYGGASARPFKTHHNSLKQDLFLRISDELYLKRLIVGGFSGVYELCKDFRNEGIDRSHNPEFTMLEWYLAYGDYHEGMRMCEQLFESACKGAGLTTTISYQGRPLSLKAPFRRERMVDLIQRHAKIDVRAMDEQQLRVFCDDNAIEYERYDTWGLFVQRIFEHFCEEHLWEPTFVIDHPKETTPLCKPTRDGDARFVERFELFIAGMEIANAYSELNDPQIQRERFAEQEQRRMQGDEEAEPTDSDFVEALEYAMPPTSGVGIGIDRVVMLLTDSASIRDVILFPLLRPREGR